MGGEVSFNNLEKTWDCPCHGSRFDLDGNVLGGPAKLPLEKIVAPEKKSAAPRVRPGLKNKPEKKRKIS